MAGGFRVQTQRDALRMTRNNNEHQCKNKGRMATVGAALVAALPSHRGRPQGAPLQIVRPSDCAARIKQKPGAVSRPGAILQFQFPE
jgi:hypothetical protein